MSKGSFSSGYMLLTLAISRYEARLKVPKSAPEFGSSKHNVVMCYSLMMFHAASALKITGFGWTADPVVEINNPSFHSKVSVKV